MVKQIYNPHEDDELFNVHVVIFTCAASRAVHLDIVPNTGSSAFLRSLKRFMSRRGIPSLMISDNATCFKSEKVRLSEELLRLGIRWKFIVESSSWWGGFWERLIKSIKRSLNRIIFRASVNYEELLTIIIEIETIMNSRPLTYIGNEVDEILTPGHLLIGKRIIKENDDTFNEHEVSDRLHITKRASYLKSVSEHYWKRSKAECLLELRKRHIQNGESETKINIGEVAVINEQTKRNFWRLGVITKLIEGSDKKARVVVLKTTRNGKSNFLRRPIEKLHPLEIRSQTMVNKADEAASDACTDGCDDVIDENIVVFERPRRVAADNGTLIRRLTGN